MGRVITIIAEGATPSLLERWMMADALPSFTSLREHGTWGELKSLPVPYELPALASAFTGVPPGEHGCFSMWHTHGPTFNAVPEVVLSHQIEAPFLWHWPQVAERRMAVVNIIGTHPPKPVNGYLITYPFTPTLRACYPDKLLRELSYAGISYGHDFSAFYGVTPVEQFIPLVEKIEAARMQACLELLKRGADLCIFNLTIIDRLSHFFWSEVEEGSIMPEDRSALWRAYGMVDDFIARILNELRADDHLLVFSEIGFGPLSEYVSVDKYLADAGLLMMKGEQVDAHRTIAREAVQGTQGINLNLRRRYEDGIIPDKDEARWLEDVRQVLLAAVNRRTGKPLFKDVLKACELYQGKKVGQAPDLILVPADERYLPLGHSYWAERVSRQAQTGWHRRGSFWSGVGAKFKSGAMGTSASCMDIAATIASCLDISLPITYGRALTDSIQAEAGLVQVR